MFSLQVDYIARKICVSFIFLSQECLLLTIMVFVWCFVMCSLAFLKAKFTANMKLDTREKEASKKISYMWA